MQTKTVLLLTLSVVACLVLDGCFAEAVVVPEPPGQPAGFLAGLWHGVVAPLALFVRLFDSNVAVYDVQNVGFLYDLGFVLGLTGSAGSTTTGVQLVRRKRE